jgi:hypothetical protein
MNTNTGNCMGSEVLIAVIRMNIINMFRLIFFSRITN